MAITLRRRIWNLVESGRGGTGEPTEHAATSERFDWFDWLIAILIAVNVAAFVLETERSLHAKWFHVFHIIEVISLSIFGAEYLLRIWSCTASGHYAHPIWGRLKFALRPLLLIDLLVLLPGLLFFMPDLRAVRVIRLLRIARVLKIGRYSEAVGLLGRVLRSRTAELGAMVLVLVVLLILAATAMHFAEDEAQPEKFGSIPEAMWWAIITLTTIGYGDVYPITPIGKLIGGVIAVSGIGIVALPTAIIASAFSEELRKAAERKKKLADHHHPQADHPASPASGLTCPHCGKSMVIQVQAAEG